MLRSSSFLLSLLFVLIWGCGAVVIKLGLAYTNPFFFVLLRFIIAMVFMLLIIVFLKSPWPKSWKEVSFIALTGLFTQFGYVSTYFCALYYGVSPTLLAIVLALQPTLTAIIAGVIFKEHINKYKIIGLIMGLVGVMLVIMHDAKLSNELGLGLIFTVFCLLSITIGSLLQKRNVNMDLLTGSTIQFAVSIPFVLILTCIFGDFKAELVPKFIFSLTYMSLIISVVATCIYYQLLKAKSAVSVSSLFYLVPGVTAVASYFVFDYKLSVMALVGIVLVIIGVFLTQKTTNQ